MKNRLLQTTNLQQDARLASRRQVPILLVFSQEDCPFCERLKKEIIEPMLISGDYTHRVLIREFMIDDDDSAIGFDGKPVAPMDVFQNYGLFVTPSVLLLDNQGVELAERLVGINTVDYYGYYLDEAIDKALLKIGQPPP